MTLFLGFLVISCEKDIENYSIGPTEDLDNSISERTEDEYPRKISISYLLNGYSISESSYNNLDSTYWFHSTTKVVGDTTKIEGHAFSTKNLYEAWGVLNSIQVAKMNAFDDRIKFIADSLGITSLVEHGQAIPNTLLQVYLNMFNQTYGIYYPQSQTSSPTLYSGSKFYENNCNPADPNCVPGGAEMALIMTAPTWLHTFTPWMEDNAEAWEPRLTAPSVGSKVTLRAWSYPFYVTPWWQSWKKRHTVIFGSAPPPGIKKIWTPFIGPISVWSNRISSWTILPEI